MRSSNALGCLSVSVVDETKDCKREEELVVSLDSENVNFIPLKGTYIGRSATNQPLTENEISTKRIRDGFKEGFLIGTCLSDPSADSSTDRKLPIIYRGKAAQNAIERGLTPPLVDDDQLLATKTTRNRYSAQQRSRVGAASQQKYNVKDVKSQRGGIQQSAIPHHPSHHGKMQNITKRERRDSDGAKPGFEVTNETNHRLFSPNSEQIVKRHKRESLFGDRGNNGQRECKKQPFQRALGRKRSNGQKRTNFLFE